MKIEQINLRDGKYSIIQKENGSLEALRYGESWRDLTGDNLVYAMTVEIQKLTKALSELLNTKKL